MSRGLVGLGAGVAGTTAYLRPDILLEWARSARVSGPGAGDIEALSKVIEQLSREIKAGNNGVTIVQGDRSNNNAIIYTITLAGLGTIVYISLIRGWRLSDLWFVTRRQFNNGIASLTSGLDTVSSRVTELRQKLQARIAELARKQDDTLAAVDAVGQDVDALRSQVGQIHGLVLDVESSLSEMGANQRHALHGIYILCKAVGELTQGSNIPSKAELMEYTQHPIWQRERLNQGLGSILTANTTAAAATDDIEGIRLNEAGGTRRRPFLLSTTATGGGLGGGLLKTLPSDGPTNFTGLGGRYNASSSNRVGGSTGFNGGGHVYENEADFAW